MKELNIKNRTQVETWWRWYRNEESYRFSQHVGKQYTYGKGLEELSVIATVLLIVFMLITIRGASVSGSLQYYFCVAMVLVLHLCL